MNSVSENIAAAIEKVQLDWSFFGETIYHAGESFGPDTPAHYLITWIKKGEAKFSVDDQSFSLNKGEMALIPGNKKKYFYFPKRTLHHWCIFLPNKSLHSVNKSAVAKLPLSISMQSLFSMGMNFGLRQNPFVRAQRNLVAKAMLAEYLYQQNQEEGALDLGSEFGQQPAPIARCISYMYIHHGEDLDLSRLAAAAEVSPAHLIRLFSKHMNSSPIKTLWQIRTEIGMRQLEWSGISVNQIAEKCGFKSQAHFSRLVKEASGVAPLQFRKRAWSG